MLLLLLNDQPENLKRNYLSLALHELCKCKYRKAHEAIANSYVELIRTVIMSATPMLLKKVRCLINSNKDIKVPRYLVHSSMCEEYSCGPGASVRIRPLAGQLAEDGVAMVLHLVVRSPCFLNRCSVPWMVDARTEERACWGDMRWYLGNKC
jgi:hypothetical protein